MRLRFLTWRWLPEVVVSSESRRSVDCAVWGEGSRSSMPDIFVSTNCQSNCVPREKPKCRSQQKTANESELNSVSNWRQEYKL